MTWAQWCLTPQGIHSFIHSFLVAPKKQLGPFSDFSVSSRLFTWDLARGHELDMGSMLGRLIFITPFGDLPKNSKPSTILFG